MRFGGTPSRMLTRNLPWGSLITIPPWLPTGLPVNPKRSSGAVGFGLKGRRLAKEDKKTESALGWHLSRIHYERDSYPEKI